MDDEWERDKALKRIAIWLHDRAQRLAHMAASDVISEDEAIEKCHLTRSEIVLLLEQEIPEGVNVPS